MDGYLALRPLLLLCVSAVKALNLTAEIAEKAQSAQRKSC